MSEFRVFKQVPRILFGAESSKRLHELTPPKSLNSDYAIYIIDDVFKNSQIVKNFPIDAVDLIEWFSASDGEPSTRQVDELLNKVRRVKGANDPIFIVGIGGGSTMDVAKALSLMFKNEGSASDYQGWDLVKRPGIYKVGIPTVAGSGAEASRTAVLMGKDRKFGINSDHSMFDAIILDSEMISGVPSNQRFHSGMDCYIHCVESITGTMINALAKGNAEKALELCAKVFLDTGDEDELMSASYMGGVSIVNSEVGICHALSYGLSLELGLRHGFANCVAFNVLDEYYGDYVKKFRQMLNKNSISLPQNICKNLDQSIISRMVEMTVKMERPLTNALGKNWAKLLPKEKIADLYRRM